MAALDLQPFDDAPASGVKLDLQPTEEVKKPGLADMAKEAVGEALDAPISAPGAPVDLAAIKEGVKGAANTAEQFYSQSGPASALVAPMAYMVGGSKGVGKAVGTGGRIVADMIPSHMKDALFLAAAGPAMEAASVVGKPVLKAGGNFLADIAGELAGKSPEVVKAVFTAPGSVWKKATEVFSLKNQEALVKSIGEGLESQGRQFKQLEEGFSGFAGTPSAGKGLQVDLEPAFNKVRTDMVKGGHRLPEALAGDFKMPLEGRLAQDSHEYQMLSKKLSFLKDNPKMSFGEALNQRRQLDDMINYGVDGSNGIQPVSDAAGKVLKNIRKEISSALRQSVPEEVRPLWDKANDTYAKASSAYAELRRQVVGTTPRQTEHKLLQMITEGRYDDEVISRAEKLGDAATRAFEEVRTHLAAAQFKRWGGGGIKTGAFGFFPTSPRTIGHGIEAAGAAYGGADALAQQVMQSPTASAAVARGVVGGPTPPRATP